MMPGPGSPGAHLHADQRALAVDGLAQRVDHPAEHAVADGHRQDAAGGPDRLALPDLGGIAQHHAADRLLVEVEGQAQGAALELEQLVDGRVGQPRHGGDAVTDLGDVPDLAGLEVGLEALEALAEGFGDVAR